MSVFFLAHSGFNLIFDSFSENKFLKEKKIIGLSLQVCFKMCGLAGLLLL